MLEWLNSAYPDLIVLFADSAEVSLMPTITRCWSRVGQQKVIQTPGVRARKKWDWGAVEPTTGRTVHIVHSRRNNIGFRRLLAAISRVFELPTNPQRRVILIVDNDKAHKAKIVQKLLAKHGQRIQIEWLPPYSPELNPQEDIWRHMRRCVTHNNYFQHIEFLEDAVDDFHQELTTNTEQVRRLMRPWLKRLSS